MVTEDHIYQPDFTKLCNLLKDEIDHLLSKDCPNEIPVFGMLIRDYQTVGEIQSLFYRNHEVAAPTTKTNRPQTLSPLNPVSSPYNTISIAITTRDSTSTAKFT